MNLSAVMSLYVCSNSWNQQLNYDAQKVQEWWFPIYDSNNQHSLRYVKKLITKILTLKRIQKHRFFFFLHSCFHYTIWSEEHIQYVTYLCHTASVTHGKKSLSNKKLNTKPLYVMDILNGKIYSILLPSSENWVSSIAYTVFPSFKQLTNLTK